MSEARGAPSYRTLWVQVFRGHTISRRGIKVFNCLRRHFPSTRNDLTGPRTPADDRRQVDDGGEHGAHRRRRRLRGTTHGVDDAPSRGVGWRRRRNLTLISVLVMFLSIFCMPSKSEATRVGRTHDRILSHRSLRPERRRSALSGFARCTAGRATIDRPQAATGGAASTEPDTRPSP
jgi:hypothetical protein